jgi:RNA recognition motif-containing protein
MFDKELGKSRGHGYLNFHDKNEALRCLNEMNNTVLDGK